jgi:hypothetical protein
MRISGGAKMRYSQEAVGGLSHRGNHHGRMAIEVIANDRRDAQNCFGGLH